MKKITILVGLLSTLSLLLVACGTSVTGNKNENIGVNSTNVEKDNMDYEEEMLDESHEDKVLDEGQEEKLMDEDAGVKEEDASELMNEGEVVSDYKLVDLDGEMISLADFKGEKVYVKYWASWCSICLTGLDEIDELSTNEDFKVITIVAPRFNGEKSIEDFKEWFAGLEKENTVVLFDEEALYAQDFGVFAVPTSIYIGSDGVQTLVTTGHASSEQIIETIDGIY